MKIFLPGISNVTSIQAMFVSANEFAKISHHGMYLMSFT